MLNMYNKTFKCLLIFVSGLLLFVAYRSNLVLNVESQEEENEFEKELNQRISLVKIAKVQNLTKQFTPMPAVRNQKKYIVFECKYICGGWGDRLKGNSLMVGI